MAKQTKTAGDTNGTTDNKTADTTNPSAQLTGEATAQPEAKKDEKPAPKKNAVLTRKDLKAMSETDLNALKAQNDKVIAFCEGDGGMPDACAAQKAQNEVIESILTGGTSNAIAEEMAKKTEVFNAFAQTKMDDKSLKAVEPLLEQLTGEAGLPLRARIKDGVLTFEVIRLKAKSGTVSAGGGTGTKNSNPYELFVVKGKTFDSPLAAIGFKKATDGKYEKTGEGVASIEGVADFRLPESSFSAPRILADLAKKWPVAEVKAVIETDRETETADFCKLNEVPTGTLSIGEGDKKVDRMTVDLAKHYFAFAK